MDTLLKIVVATTIIETMPAGMKPKYLAEAIFNEDVRDFVGEAA
jgi:hypothetical protein